MMVRWMCGVSLKDRKQCDLYSLLIIQSVANVVRCRRLRWLGHRERKNVDDWVSACRRQGCDVGGLGGGMGRLGENEWMIDMEVLGLHPEWEVFRDMCWDFI